VLAQEPRSFLRRADIGPVDPLVDRAAQAMLASAPLQGRRVIACWAFGSKARGEGRADSDVDPAVNLDHTYALARLACAFAQVDQAPTRLTVGYGVISVSRGKYVA